MRGILYAEILKLIRSKMVWQIPLGSAITVLSGIIAWQNVRNSFGSIIGWQYLLPLTEDRINSGYISIVVALLSIYIFSNEYKNNMVYSLFTYPVSRLKIFIAKLFLVFIITALSIFLILILTLGAGSLLLGNCPNKSLLNTHIVLFVYTIILNFMLISPVILLSILFKKEAVPLFVVVMIYVLSNSFRTISKTYILPWNIPKLVIQSLQQNLDPRYNLVRIDNYTQCIAVLTLCFLIPLISSIYLYCKTELNNVS